MEYNNKPTPEETNGTVTVCLRFVLSALALNQTCRCEYRLTFPSCALRINFRTNHEDLCAVKMFNTDSSKQSLKKKLGDVPITLSRGEFHNLHSSYTRHHFTRREGFYDILILPANNKTYFDLHVKYLIFLPNFNQIWIISTYFH
jgi:hypothetical protein